MWDVITKVFSTDNGVLAALILAAWRYFAGDNRAAIEQRIRECAFAAWHAAKGITGLEARDLQGAAHQRAVKMLNRLKLTPITDEMVALLDHELELLAARDAASIRVPPLEATVDQVDQVEPCAPGAELCASTVPPP